MSDRRAPLILAILIGIGCGGVGFYVGRSSAGPAFARDDANAEILPELHSMPEVRKVTENAKAKGTPSEIAAALVLIDSWAFDSSEEKAADAAKQDLMRVLRENVVKYVHAKQQAALATTQPQEGVKLHADAGQILALYPMSEDIAIIDEAKRLSAEQAELAVRLDSLRRQRYNQWAVDRIEAAIKGYYENQSYTSPKKENPELIKSLVQNLVEVDPSLLEPAPTELYNYVVNLTKGSIGEPDKIDLTKKLVDPAVRRRGLGDF